jgi:hypothetical protein
MKHDPLDCDEEDCVECEEFVDDEPNLDAYLYDDFDEECLVEVQPLESPY